MKKKFQQKNSNNTDQAIGVMHTNALTEVAGEGGPHLIVAISQSFFKIGSKTKKFYS